eukprot:403344688
MESHNGINNKYHRDQKKQQQQSQQQQLQQEINLSESDIEHNDKQANGSDSMNDDSFNDDLGSDREEGLNLGEALKDTDFKNKNIFHDKYKDKTDRASNANQQQNNRVFIDANGKQEDMNINDFPVNDNNNASDNLNIDPRKRKELEEIVAIVGGDKDLAALSDVFDQLHGNKELIIEYLLNGHIDEEVMRQHERQQRQNMRSAFEEDHNSDDHMIGRAGGAVDDEQFARRMQEKELREMEKQQRQVQEQRRIEEQIYRNSMRNTPNKNQNTNNRPANNNGVKNQYQLNNGSDVPVFDTDQVRQNQQNNRGQGIQKPQAQNKQNNGGGGFLSIFGCCTSKKQGRKNNGDASNQKQQQQQKDANVNPRSQQYIPSESLDNEDYDNNRM